MAQAGQYFVLPEQARMPVPQTSQRRSFLVGAEHGLFQLGLSRQHGAAKPPAKQTSGDVLRAGTVQQQAVAIQEVAAVLCKAAHAAELPWRQAEERAVRQPLDGVKLVHLRPPLR